LEACRERGVFFLDSHTNYRSIVSKVAKEVGVRTIDNQLFLDDVPTVRHIKYQLEKLKRLLVDSEYCVAIGHVGLSGKNTAEALEQMAPELSKEVTFVPLSQMIAYTERKQATSQTKRG